MDKSPEAFRTISEVAETLETPAHVLRFWESRFPQIRPVKRAGGRRYYRPADVALLSGIKHLLHDEGLTIRGVQKILREQGVRHVAALATGAEDAFDPEALDLDAESAVEGVLAETAPEVVESAQVVALETALRRPTAIEPGTENATAEIRALHPEPAEKPAPVQLDFAGAFEPVLVKSAPPAEPVPEAPHVWVDAEPEAEVATPVALRPMVDPVPPPRGVAARLRALPRPVSASVAVELAELHNRLGLLHAQMAEAVRLRR